MAADFFGNCQICGREQKAHEHAIAKHGYTLRNGWQQGACYGSGGKPFQVSCDLIEGAIASAHAYIERTNREIDELFASPVSTEGKNTIIFRQATRNGELAYPMDVTVRQGEKKIEAVDNQGVVRVSWGFSSGVQTVEAGQRNLADKWINLLQRTIVEAESSIRYMEERLKGWKPTELRPVTAADRSATAPKLHLAAKKYGRPTSVCVSSANGASAYKQTTTNPAEVTCLACLKEIKRLEELPALLAAQAEKDKNKKIKELERDMKMYRKLIKDGGSSENILYWTKELNEATHRLLELREASPATPAD